MKTLIEILDENKATFYLKLDGDMYDDYSAHINFEDGKITVNIFSCEGNYFGNEEEPLPFSWVEKINKVVNDLKEAKMLPEYTLNLLTEEK
jgi:hypothetical protein